jgi:predicted cupin superfamily sugar epimerase
MERHALTAKAIIKQLNLKPLPDEGGYYRETHRDAGLIPKSVLLYHSGPRSYSTSILYLITPESFSKLHAVKSTEVFHFYAGDPVRMVQINHSGTLTNITLSNKLDKGEPQVVVPSHVWQGTKLVEGGKWALLGCTVSPGFEFDDYMTGKRFDLLQKFPQHAETIRQFTRA